MFGKSGKYCKKDFTIIIHGKYIHEETRATFSHSNQNAPTVVIRDMEEAKVLAEFINGTRKKEEFYEFFRDKYSKDFDPNKDLVKIGVVNQTTMLASETEEISEFLKSSIIERYERRTTKTILQIQEILFATLPTRTKSDLRPSRRRSRFSYCCWWL